MPDGAFTAFTHDPTGHLRLPGARMAAALIAASSLPALVGCTPDSSDPNGGASARIVEVTSTDHSCDVSAETAPAGRLVYKVTNSGSTPTAFYLYDPVRRRIVGSVEDIGPGLTRDLVLNLPAGRYVRTCEPSAAGEGGSGGFTVTHSGDRARPVPAVGQAQIDTATADYEAYVRQQADQLLTATRQFARAYVGGDDRDARRLYPTTRVHLKRIEPVAELFPALDQRIDDRAVDVPRGREWVGWHRIERQLWPPTQQSAMQASGGSAAQRSLLARQLLRDTRALCAGMRGLTFTVEQIADGATSLLEEVATDSVTGEEEVWSHLDLYDVEASIDGARAVFDALRPLLAVKQPGLEARIVRRFHDVHSHLRPYQVSGGGFVGYDSLSVGQVRQLSNAVNALAEPLSMMTAAVAM